jgi:hypothetical protein
VSVAGSKKKRKKKANKERKKEKGTNKTLAMFVALVIAWPTATLTPGGMLVPISAF